MSACAACIALALTMTNLRLSSLGAIGRFHSWASASASGSTRAVQATVIAARFIATTPIHLMPEAIAGAQAELRQKQGANFQAKALLGDEAPRLDYTDARMGKR